MRVPTAAEVKLARTLQALFVAQARDAATKVRLDGGAPDMSAWPKIMLQAVKPIMLDIHQQGMVRATARIAAKVGTSPAKLRDDTALRQDLVGARRVHLGNEAAFGPRKNYTIGRGDTTGQPSSPVPGRPFIMLRKGSRVVCKAAGTATGTPELSMDFDLFSPRVLDAVDLTTYAFCKETMDTAVADLTTTLEALRQAMREGLSRGDAVQMLAKRVRELFADPARAFRIATTESSRAMNEGQLMSARDSGLELKKEWLCSSDACVFCQELGELPPRWLTEPFYVDPKGGPYSVIMTPPAHPHCFCSMTEVLV